MGIFKRLKTIWLLFRDSIKVAKKKITDKTRKFYGKNVQVLVSTLAKAWTKACLSRMLGN